MSKRKILVAAMALCMVAILAVGGSLAFFMDTEKATNTMVIGNVAINIEEYTYDSETQTWAPFVDEEFTLYPIESAKVHNSADANKVVHTFNTSPSEDAAYIRTIVLFEANDLLDANYVGEDDCCLRGLHFGFFNSDEPVKSSDGKVYHGSTSAQTLANTVEIKGEKYWVVVFEERNGNAIPYGEALYTLSKVWMDKNITSEQIAGWNDNKVDIIVFSQAIQSEGLDHATAMKELGEVNQANLTKWLDGGDNAEINDLDYKEVNPTAAPNA